MRFYKKQKFDIDIFLNYIISKVKSIMLKENPSHIFSLLIILIYYLIDQFLFYKLLTLHGITTVSFKLIDWNTIKVNTKHQFCIDFIKDNIFS